MINKQILRQKRHSIYQQLQIFKMMQHRMGSQQIFNYLVSKGVNLSSDKVFKEPQKDNNRIAIWNSYAFIAQSMKDQHIENLQASLTYLLDNERHAQSAKWVRQHIIISDVFRRLSLPYKLNEMFKPQKQKVHAYFTRLIQLHKNYEKVLKKYDQEKIKWQMNKEILIQSKRKKQQNQLHFISLKNKKQEDKPLYNQKIQSIKQLENTLSQKRLEKQTLLANQKVIEQQIKQFQVKRQQQRLQLQKKELQQVKLKKQLVECLPELMGKRINIQKDLQVKKQQFTVYENNFKAKIQLVKQQNQNAKNMLKHEHEKIKVIINLLKEIQQVQQKLSSTNGIQETLNNRLKNSQQQFLEHKNNIKQSKKSVFTIYERENNLKNQINKLQNQWVMINAEIKSIDIKIKHDEELIGRYQSVRQNLKRLMIDCKSNYQKQLQKLKQRQQQINNLANNVVKKTYSNFK